MTYIEDLIMNNSLLENEEILEKIRCFLKLISYLNENLHSVTEYIKLVFITKNEYNRNLCHISNNENIQTSNISIIKYNDYENYSDNAHEIESFFNVIKIFFLKLESRLFQKCKSLICKLINSINFI